MARNSSFAAAAATVLALLGSAVAWPQGARNSSIPAENEANARQAAVDNAARPLLAAARAKPYLGGYWRIAQPIAALTTVEGKSPPLKDRKSVV